MPSLHAVTGWIVLNRTATPEVLLFSIPEYRSYSLITCSFLSSLRPASEYVSALPG
jgi:hypothetical protein